MTKEDTTGRDGAGTETAPNGPTARENTGTGTGSGTRADGSAAAVQGALVANPGGTVATIAMAAGVSKNAARKALLALETGGLAARTAGGRVGGKRAPDAWHAATATGPAELGDDQNTDPHDIHTPDGDLPATAGQTADTPPAEDSAADEDTAPTDATADQNVDAAVVPEPEPDDPAVDETADGATADGEVTGDKVTGDKVTGDKVTEAEVEEGMDAAVVTEASDALAALRDAVGVALTALESGDRAAAVAVAETIYTGSGKARRLLRTAANGRPRNASGRARSHPGELRGKVVAHLAAHPGAEFTPHEIGKVIGHSAGAIANALDRLVTLGEAVTTCERPRRFTATPGTAAPDERAGGEEPAEPTTT